jgi:hypothetical protein
VWLEKIGVDLDNDFYDLCTGATCLAKILNVTSIPLTMVNSAGSGRESGDSGGESHDSVWYFRSEDPELGPERIDALKERQRRVTGHQSIESANSSSPNKLSENLDQLPRLQPSEDQLSSVLEQQTEQTLAIDNHYNNSNENKILTISAPPPQDNIAPKETRIVSPTSDSDNTAMRRLRRVATSKMQAEDHLELELEAKSPDDILESHTPNDTSESDDSALGIALLCGNPGQSIR